MYRWVGPPTGIQWFYQRPHFHKGISLRTATVHYQLFLSKQWDLEIIDLIDTKILGGLTLCRFFAGNCCYELTDTIAMPCPEDISQCPSPSSDSYIFFLHFLQCSLSLVEVELEVLFKTSVFLGFQLL